MSLESVVQVFGGYYMVCVGCLTLKSTITSMQQVWPALQPNGGRMASLELTLKRSALFVVYVYWMLLMTIKVVVHTAQAAHPSGTTSS